MWMNQAARPKLNRLLTLAVITLASFSVLKADRLDTVAYNFPLIGGGGGSSALLDQTTTVEIYCNDFNNDIYVPHSNYSATLSLLSAPSPTTRFGGMDASGFKAVTINDGDSDDSADANAINTADALARYQMAAYLVSQYQPAAGNNSFNNNIQMAIWEILDPTGYPDPMGINPSAQPTEAFEMASAWYLGTNEAGRESYLSNYRIVSDSTMTCSKLASGACAPDMPLVGGFQEQIAFIPTPEPALSSLLAGATFLLICVGWRRRPGGAAAARPSGCPATFLR